MSLVERGIVVAEKPNPTEVPKTYDADFDSRDFAELRSLRSILTAEAYQERREMLKGKVRFNQETWLGERFNAGLSSRTDRIVNNQILSEFSDEPQLAMFERGRDFRFAHSSPHDRLREAAEVDGFRKIQAVLTDEATPLGTMMVSISPPGGEQSFYKHNFYDVFTLKEVNGKRAIEASRYSSALGVEQYHQFADYLDEWNATKREASNQPSDVYYLSNPLRIIPESGIRSADTLHALLHTDHQTVSREVMEYVFEGCDALFLAYTNLLERDPEDTEGRNEILNTIMNKADTLVAQFEREQAVRGDGYHTIYERSGKHVSVEEDIKRWGRVPVREMTTGCGISGGFDVSGGSAIGAFSVSEFGTLEDKYGKLSFKCPHCDHENTRPYGKLIKYCQSVACQRDVSC